MNRTSPTQLQSVLLAAALSLTTHAALAADDNYALSLDPFPTESAASAPTLPDTTPEPSLPLLDAATLPSADTAVPPPKANPLSLSFELPVWLPSINGTTGVRGLVVPTNASFTQILDAADSIAALGGRLEADYGPWIFYGSGIYMKLAKDNVGPGPVNIKFISELVIADAGILYQIGRWNISGKGGSADPSIALALGAAARYMHVGLELQPQRLKSRQANEDWADPLFAGQLVLDLDKHWEVLTRGDVGGGSSQLTWSTGVFVGYRFNFCPTVTGCVKAGYEAVTDDYTNGSGANKFTWDEILHGPVISFAVGF